MDPEDLRPIKKPDIVVGEDLSRLSVAELAQRIVSLESEIVRTRDMLASKQSSKSAADAFFRK